MVKGRGGTVLALFAAAAALFPAAVRCAEPEKLRIPVFSAAVTDGEGKEGDTYSRSSRPHLDLSFALALSASPRYAATITVVQDAEGKIAQDVLYQGVLEEGHYRLFAPLPPPPGGGTTTVKVILRVRFFPKKFTGESIYVYRQWEGTFRYGG